AGLVTRGRQAQWRPVRLEAEPLQLVSEWVSGYRQFWSDNLDRLDEYLQDLQQRQKEHPQ
ncbi:MAG: sdpR 2, partial [Thermoleophilia bacterium]|nr:sdpR 2 [Thermoleophilia bacterium]